MIQFWPPKCWYCSLLKVSWKPRSCFPTFLCFSPESKYYLLLQGSPSFLRNLSNWRTDISRQEGQRKAGLHERYPDTSARRPCENSQKHSSTKEKSDDMFYSLNLRKAADEEVRHPSGDMEKDLTPSKGFATAYWRRAKNNCGFWRDVLPH